MSAPINKIYAHPGTIVKKGDLLLELDDRDFRRQVRVIQSKLKYAKANLLKMQTGARPEDVRILKANLAKAQADLDLAIKQLERHAILLKKHAVSEQAYDQAKTTVKGMESMVAALQEQLARDTKGARKEDIMAAKANIEELKAQLSIAEDRLADTRLTAPFNGVVTRKIPHTHEMVTQGETVIVLEDILDIEVPVHVPETLVGQVLALKRAANFTASFPISSGRSYPARLKEYSSRADQATGTYEFIFSVSPEANDLIFPGMTSEILVGPSPGKGQFRGLEIPLQSLLGAAGNTAHVFLVNPETHRVERRIVTFESLAGSHKVNVLSGLFIDDLVVDQGAVFIRQDEIVKFELPSTQG